MAAHKQSMASFSPSDIFEITVGKGVITPAISTSVFKEVSKHLDKKLLFNCPEDFEPDASFIQLLFILRSEKVNYSFSQTFSAEIKELLSKTGLIEILPNEGVSL